MPMLSPPPEIMAAMDAPGAIMARMTTAFRWAAVSPHREVSIDFTADPPVPAALIRWLLLRAVPGLGGDLSRLVVIGATIQGTLDLADRHVIVTPCFAGCRFVVAPDGSGGGIDLTDASVAGFEVIGGEVACLHADRLTAEGTVLLRGGGVDPTDPRVRPAGLPARIWFGHGILLSGAKIRGNLDLRGARLDKLPHPVDGAAVALLADGVSIEGNALFCEQFRADGEIRLNGAHIERSLVCSGARLSNPGGYSLSAAGARIDGSAYFRPDTTGQRFTSVGSLRLDGATIKGDLDATAAHLTATAFDRDDWKPAPNGANADELIALRAVALDVSAVVWLSHGFTARGAINLISAKIGTDLVCSSGTFHFPGEEAFYADGATISGGTYFDNARTTGLIRFVQSELKQGCSFEDFTIDLGFKWRDWGDAGALPDPEMDADVAGLAAASTVIGGSFIWSGVSRAEQGADRISDSGRSRRTVWLSAPGASVTEVSDDEDSWNAVDQINVRDCVYRRIDQLTADADWRLARLDKQYAPWNTERHWSGARLMDEVYFRTLRGEQHQDKGLGLQVRRFAPDPYLQLARVLGEAGFASSAQSVLLRLERNRARYSGLSTPELLWRWVLDAALQHGQKPFRPLFAIGVWTLISAVLFKWVYDTQLQSGVTALRLASATDHVTFNGLFYALDTLIPFVDFGQKKSFIIDPIMSPGGALLLFNTILGYAAASFFAAGLSGLVRTGKG